MERQVRTSRSPPSPSLPRWANGALTSLTPPVRVRARVRDQVSHFVDMVELIVDQCGGTFVQEKKPPSPTKAPTKVTLGPSCRVLSR
jgi:hypothetical protein